MLNKLIVSKTNLLVVTSFVIICCARLAFAEYAIVNTKAICDAGCKPSISNNIIAFRISESNLGIDLNGDRYIEDSCLGYFDISNSRVVYTSTYCQPLSPKVSDNFISFTQREDVAVMDLTGDGDFNDYVPVVFNILTGELINSRSPTSSALFAPDISGGKIAYSVFESGAGIDLNGDGDIIDDVLGYFDIPSRKIVNLRRIGAPVISNRVIAFSTGTYFSYFDFQTQEIIDTQIKHAYGSLAVDNDKIAFLTSEASLGEDLNGDGDTLDYIVRYYDATTKQVFNTGAESTRYAYPAIAGNIIAFVTSEAVVGPLGEDLNGDGDKLDNVVRYYDISTGRIVNTKAETISTVPATSRNIIAFLTYEGSVGPSGVDLNGDGDKYDKIVRYYDIASGTIGNTGERANDDSVSVSNNIIAFATVESGIGRSGVDVNGDGDKSDNIIRYVIVGAQNPTTTTTTIPTTTTSTTTTTVPTTTTTKPTTTTTTTTTTTIKTTTTTTITTTTTTTTKTTTTTTTTKTTTTTTITTTTTTTTKTTTTTVPTTTTTTTSTTTTTLPPGPQPVKNLAARRVGDTFILNWDANGAYDLQGYNVYYDFDNSQPPYNGTGALEGNSGEIVITKEVFNEVKSDATKIPQLTFLGLPEGIKLYVVVTAVNYEGKESDYSDVVIPSSVSINQGAETTTSRYVYLYLTYCDKMTQMSISKNGEMWSIWLDVRPIKKTRLTLGAGEKTVYVKFRSNNKIYEPVMDTIVLEQ